MKILVTAKRVTDPDAKIRLKPDCSGIVEDDVEYKINPFCENAIEAALQLQEAHGGEVVVVGVGPDEAEKKIRDGLALGGDRGIRVEGDDMALDGDLVARILAALFRREKPDVVILGKQAVDGDSNQVGQLTAEYLGLPQGCFISKLEVAGGKAKVAREVDGGIQWDEVDLPAVLTADLRLNEPRYAKLRNIMLAKKKQIELLTMADLGVDPALKVRTVRYEAPPERAGGKMVADVAELVDKLQNEAKVL